jgi:hypothetical protein
MVTEGDWDFFPKPGMLESFYDGQAQSLLHGRIDVSMDAIDGEAFMRNGKAYGYFGPTPALMRLPLQLLLPGMYGRWTRVSMLLASLLTIGMLLLLMHRLEPRFPAAGRPRLRNALRAALILAAAIGSTNFFVSAEKRVFQESILWASALAFAHFVFLACYLIGPKAKWLALACATAVLAFLARVSSGAGPLAALLVLDAVLLFPASRFGAYFAGRAMPRRAAAAVSTTLIACAALWAGLNYWKFGTAFVSQPIAWNLQFTPERVQRVKGELFSLYNLPLTLSSYLSPSHIEFRSGFPWLFLTQGDPLLRDRFPKAHFDFAEPFAGLPAAMPELLLASMAGTVLCLAGRGKELRELRAPLCGALAGCGLMFTWGAISYRYLHDMFPWLVLGSSVAVAYVPSLPRKALRYGLAGLFVAATGYAACANCAFAFRTQRYSALYPIQPEKRMGYLDLSSVIDTGGLHGFLWYLGHWRRYIPAAAFHGGNLLADYTQLAERKDQPVVLSQGQPPYGAEYAVDLPATGTYQVAIRYAAAEPRPLHLFVNGRDVKEVCGAVTGGWSPANQVWSSAGLFQLNGGANRIALASEGPFPPVSMLRLVRIE